ncbi:MAG TPA: type II secretion system protein [Terriglobales bacterium]|nr:type II secretion system protein [Terriglobales bacterium]
MTEKNGFSLLELVIVVAIILTITAIAVPSFMRSRIAANESAAVTHIRTLSTAEIAYAQTYPQIGYTCTIAELGPPPSGSPLSSTTAGIIDSVLASGTKQGYSFSLTNCAGTPKVTYNSGGVPTNTSTGVRSFCSNASGIIWYGADGTVSTCQSAGVIIR